MSSPSRIPMRVYALRHVQSAMHALCPLRDRNTPVHLGHEKHQQPFEQGHVQAIGDWDVGRDEVNDAKYFSDARPIDVGPVVVIPEPFAAWEFSFVPTEKVDAAFTLAYSVIKKSVYDYCMRNFHDDCCGLWDAPCDVNFEGELRAIFGRDGLATGDLTWTERHRFSRALDSMYLFRCHVAHGFNRNRGGASLQVACQWLSRPKALAELLGDQSAIQQLDALMEDLQDEAREAQRFIEERWTLEGASSAARGWPRHCERLFSRVVFLDASRHGELPPFVLEAARNWDTVYSLPGQKR